MEKEKVIGRSKLSRKYQITVPKTVRVFLEIKEGDTIEFVLDENNKVYIRKTE